jgi:hypothetical protein
MKCPIRFKRLLVTGTIAAAAAAGPLASVAHAEPEAPTVPTEIEVEAGNKVFLVGHATGVQIYRCNATAGGYRWDSAGPRGRPRTGARSSASSSAVSSSTRPRSPG